MSMVRPLRTGGRVVEGTALEMRHTGNRIEGSNPSLSATIFSLYTKYLDYFITLRQPAEMSREFPVRDSERA